MNATSDVGERPGDPPDQDALAGQLAELGALQTLQPTRELLYQYKLGREVWKGWRSSPPARAISTRSILLNELVFDLDAERWEDIFSEGNKLVNYLRAKRIPHVIAHSGGKGLHVHVLVDPRSYVFDESVAEGLKSYGVDVWAEVRRFLVSYIASEARMDMDRAKVDWKKVNWSTNKKGSVIRAFGCPREDGGYKTVVPEVPAQRPAPGSLPLIFPSRWEQWSVASLKPNLDGLFRSKLRACADSKLDGASVSSGLDEFPCYSRLRRGLPDGLRNEGAFIVSVFNRIKGVPEADAERAVAEYSRACAGYSPSVEAEHRETLKSVYSSEYHHPCCRKIRDIDASLCDRASCPLRRAPPIPDDESEPWRCVFPFAYNTALHEGIVSPDERSVDVQAAAEHILKYQPMVNLKVGDNVELRYYEDGLYLPLGVEKVGRLCEELLHKKATTRVVNEITRKIERMLEPRESDDGNPEGWICTEDGYLNVFDRSYEKHSPARVFTQRLPVVYDPGAECPRVRKFLSEITDLDTDPDALLEVIGYCLMPGYRYQWIPIFLGEGENGKGVLSNLIVSLFGRGNVSTASLQELGENRFASSDLYGKMVNLCGDLDAADLKHTGIIKRLTGGDLVRAERKGQHAFTFYNRAKVLAACNRIPYTKDDTRGFTRRPRVFLFPHQFTGDRRDPDLLSKLTTEEERSGLLNEALAGLERLMDQGHLTGRENEDREIERYITMQDSASRFLNLFCMEEGERVTYDRDGQQRIVPAGKVGKADLYETYRSWCKTTGFMLQSDKMFSRTLRQMFPNVREGKWGRDMPDTPNSRCWVGLTYDDSL